MMQTIFDQHERIALQVSGGKDSLACLFLMEPYWHQMTVYWVNTGDAFPETENIMAYVKSMVPNFVEINGLQPQVIKLFGIPSDVVPASNTEFGVMVGDPAPLIQDRYSCCQRVMMQPMARRMIADDVTLVIRGQKNSDHLKAAVKSGTVENGITYIFPIEDWTDQQVADYLDLTVGIPLPRFYETMTSAPDCRTCSAYWDTNSAQYLKRYHPEQYEEVQRRLGIIGSAVEKHMMNFYNEVE